MDHSGTGLRQKLDLYKLAGLIAVAASAAITASAIGVAVPPAAKLITGVSLALAGAY